MGSCALALCPDTKASMGEGLRFLPTPILPLPWEAEVGWGRQWHAKQKEAEERGSWAHHTD